MRLFLVAMTTFDTVVFLATGNLGVLISALMFGAALVLYRDGEV